MIIKSRYRRSSPRVLIIGRGALGTAFGASLASAGCTVAIASDTLRAESHAELVLRCDTGTTSQGRAAILGRSQDWYTWSPDLVLVTSKLYQLRRSGSLTKFTIDTPIFFVQNGLVGLRVPNLHTLVVEAACKLRSPGEAIRTISSAVHLSTLAPAMAQQALQTAGWRVRLHQDMLQWELRKFMLAATSAWMAARDQTIERFFASWADPGFAAFIDETAAVLQALAASEANGEAIRGVRETLEVVKQRGLIDNGPCGVSSSVTSLYQDLERRRGVTEVELLNGKIARVGARLGVPAPLNSKICAIISHAAQARLTPEEISHRLPTDFAELPPEVPSLLLGSAPKGAGLRSTEVQC